MRRKRRSFKSSEQLFEADFGRTGKAYPLVLSEIWTHYEKNMPENFPCIGGDGVSGTGNLTGAYCFVSMGEVLKRYGVGMEEIVPGQSLTDCVQQEIPGM